MAILEPNDSFGVFFNMLKIKYATYDESITKLGFVTPNDKINCFINLETALKYVSMVKDLDKKLMIDRRYPDNMIVDIINIAAHYKDFFKGNGLECNIFLYMTDLESDITKFQESKHNDEFRSYYLMKYNSNPRYVIFGEKLKSQIIPEAKKICDFIPNVYLITGTNIDGGVIPYIIGQKYPGWLNFIVSGDLHDTQYSYEDHFTDHLFLRGYGTNILACTTKDYLRAIAKSDTIDDNFVKLFQNGAFYRTLLACIGDKYRSIGGVRGIKFAKLIKILMDALKKDKITQNTHNAMLLSSLFPTEVQAQIYSNLLMIDIHNEIEMLGKGQIDSITSQIIDRSDITALKQLNNTRFLNNQLHLEGLLR